MDYNSSSITATQIETFLTMFFDFLLKGWQGFRIGLCQATVCFLAFEWQLWYYAWINPLSNVKEVKKKRMVIQERPRRDTALIRFGPGHFTGVGVKRSVTTDPVLGFPSSLQPHSPCMLNIQKYLCISDKTRIWTQSRSLHIKHAK